MVKVSEFSDICLSTAEYKKICIGNFIFWSQEEEYYSLGFGTELKLIKNSKKKTIKISKEFYSNGATVPFFLKKIIPPVGRNYDTACFYHDFLYTYGPVHGISRLEADEIFYQIMKICEVNFFLRRFLFVIVRIFGRAFFAKISQANQ